MQLRTRKSIRVPILMSIDHVQPPSFTPPTATPVAPVRPADEAPKQQPVEPKPEPVKAKAPEPQDVVAAASRAYQTMRESERTLNFEATDTGLRIEVYDANGKLVRSIPPNEQMALSAAKGTAWQA
jgi:hypothetical protein